MQFLSFFRLQQAVTDSLLLGMRRELIVLVFVCLERSNSTLLVRKVSKLVSGWLVKVKSPSPGKKKLRLSNTCWTLTI